MSLPKSILAAALACFTDHPAEVQVHVTEDGNAWLGAHRNLAQAHASHSKLPAPVTVTRADVGLEEVPQGQGQDQGQEQDQVQEQVQEQDLVQDDAAAAVEPIGSQEYGDTVSIKGKKVPMGEVVKHALSMTGLTVEQWNAQEADERELAIDLSIEELKG